VAVLSPLLSSLTYSFFLVLLPCSRYGPNAVSEMNVGWVMGQNKLPRGRANSLTNALASSPSASSLGSSPASEGLSVRGMPPHPPTLLLVVVVV
jgi:hypothetical protein